MEIYVLEYFLFTFFTSFGVIQAAAAKSRSLHLIAAFVVIVGAYVWFFASRDRNVHTIIEGVQLFSIFAISTMISLLLTKIVSLVTKSRK